MAQFRSYDPTVGRWLHVDPLAEWAPNWTPYRFGFNNPISYSDRFGLFESREAARDHKKKEGIKGRIRKREDGSYKIVHKGHKGRINTYNDSEFGVVTEIAYQQRGIHMADVGLSGVVEMAENNPNLVLYNDNWDRAYYLGKLLSFASPSGKLASARTVGLLLQGSKRFGGSKVDDLIAAANQLDKNGLTRVGRSLQKHGSRSGSSFPSAGGNEAARNLQGEEVLRAILNNPRATGTTRHHARFGDVLDIKLPNGQGARFSSDGKKFWGFIEPN